MGPVAILDNGDAAGHAAPGHPECPQRVAAIRNALQLEAADLISWRAAPPASDEALLAVHSAEHVARIDGLAAAGGGWIDADTYVTAASAELARGAAGLAIAAVDTALAGSAAFALTRPPGHHATATTAMGFCLFNNVAVATEHARARGVERVAIIDVDVHHGNGTQAIFWNDPDVLYTSIHQWPFYPGGGGSDETGEGSGLGTTLNLPQAAGTPPDVWLSAFSDQLLPAVTAFAPQLVIVSAGFDAHAGDPLAELLLDAASYGAVARAIAQLAAGAGLPSVWCLEGGYSLPALGRSAVAVVRELAATAQPTASGR